MKKTFSLAMLIVGTIIGAGFATGKEIISFFGRDVSPFVAPLVGVGIFFLCFLFCSIGRIYKSSDFSQVNAKLLGKSHVVTDSFLLLNSLIVLSGMLSGMDSLFDPILPIAPAYSIISGVLCALIVSGGLNGLLKGNSIIVPFIIIFIAAVCCFNIGGTSQSSTLSLSSIPGAIIYVCMNIMLACTVLMTVNEKPKTTLWASVIAAVIMTVLMFIIILTLNETDIDSDMPLVTVAFNTNKILYVFAVAAVATSIFTTMMTALSGLSSWLASLIGKKFSVVIALLAGLVVSNLGFNNVVTYLYPIIGIFGLWYVVACLICLLKKHGLNELFSLKKFFGKGNGKIHNRRKKA